MRSHPRDQTISSSVTEMITSHHSSSSPSTSNVSADSMNNSSSSLNLMISTEVKREGLELNLPRWEKKVKRGRRALTKEEIARKKLKREGTYTGNKQQTPLLHQKDLHGDGDRDLVITGKQLEKLEIAADPVLTMTVETQGIDEVEVANNTATSEEEVAINSKTGFDDERAAVNSSAGSDQYKDDGIIMENESFRSEKRSLPHEFTLENRVKVEGGISMMNIKQKKSLTSSMDGTYRCSECNKCFSSHQALGGHKSSHSTKKTKDVLASTSGAALEHDTRYGLVLNPTHQCKICNKSFPSGQALGGHQRSHYVQPTAPWGKEFTFGHKTVPMGKDCIIDLKSAPVVEATLELKPAAVVQELNIDIRSVVEHDFDLNELPVLEGEEVDTAGIALSISPPQPVQAA
ncbi:Zinc finger protein [Thalictrum thalictroides]|uniref:Zinc finger protein n=1 Tax=Thalictrum thalictroides TaxID=46969 RepID=A0A7J6VDS5_THATH|nr:Zinc finger protein [Thalictrum thalictroides]